MSHADTQERPKGWVRVVAVLFAIGLILDVLIGVIIILDNRQINRTVSQTNLLRIAAYEVCLKNNAGKAADAVRWDKVLRLVDTGPSTSRSIAFINGVRAANRVADAPADCGTLVP